MTTVNNQALNKDEVRIYVADLAAYNAGYLHGIWIDATLEVAEMQEQINTLLSTSPVSDADEYAIHDFEGFGDYHLGEYAGLEAAHQIALFIQEYPDFGSALLNHFNDIEEAREMAENNYCGCYASLADHAQELTEETSEIPSHLQYYIDYEAMARDMEMGGEIFSIEVGYQEVHVFWNR